MEEDIKNIQLPFFDETIFRKQLENIVQASEKAQEIIDYKSAHDDEILRSIDIVEKFLRKQHRLCYGGQAINAHLPKKYKFYNPEYSIPDYDFFTPNQDDDIRILSRDLRKAGFIEIAAREGMHEGTIKIYVNYVPVADITSIDPKLYSLLSKREFLKDGISYMDVNTLRMLMYLELSRPRGQVSRWEKVYTRLALLNELVPNKTKQCTKRILKTHMTQDEVRVIMDYIVKEKRIFAGADVVGIYKGSLHGKRKANWILRTTKPIYYYSPDIDKDTNHFRHELRHMSPDTKLKLTHIQAIGGDLISQMSVFSRNDYPILIIISQNACNAYYNIPLRFDHILRVGTLDTLITLYFSMALLNYRFEAFEALECLAQELIEISMRARAKPEEFPFAFISLDCSGHQKNISSLIREKVKRITVARKRKLQDLIQESPRKNRTLHNKDHSFL